MTKYPLTRLKRKMRAKGFTLIELLVVTGISALLLLTVTSLFATFLMSNVRTQARRQVQSEGNGAMQQIEFLVRNAQSATCSSNVLSITPVDGVAFEIQLDDERIMIDSDQYLTSDQVAVQNLEFTCQGDKPMIVVIDYDVTLDAQNFRGDNEISQNFNSRTLIRNTSF